MSTYQTTGIVLGPTNFGEADRIVRLLTPDRGKIQAVAKGVRKIKSRLAGHIETFSETQLMLATGRNLDVITSARLVFYPSQLIEDYDTLPLAFALATAIDRLIEPGSPHYKLYESFRQTLTELNKGNHSDELEVNFKLKLLDTLGYRPDLSGCVHCGLSSPNNRYSFSIERGGLLCETHTDEAAIPITANEIKYLRLSFDHPYDRLSQIQGAASYAASVLPAVERFYTFHTGRSFPRQL